MIEGEAIAGCHLLDCLIGASLSKPHINGLSGSCCYGVSYNCMSIRHTSIWPPGGGDQIYLHVSTSSTSAHSLCWTETTRTRPQFTSMENQSVQDRDEQL